jgi:sirohydrochlorin cobaltochelatase
MKTLLKTVFATALIFAFIISLSACQSASSASGNASKQALLVVSFGTSYNESRAKTIEAIEKALTATYPDYDVRRAFTSQTIINKLADRDGLQIDNVEQAMEKLVSEGFKKVVVQPTHVMSGFEYDSVIEAIEPYKAKFDSLVCGLPLLTSDADYDQVVSILADEAKAYAGDGVAIVYMGHGTEHASNTTYEKLAGKLLAKAPNHFIGTVEAEPALDDVINEVEASGATKVVLYPLMIVAGDHANNDMAGDEEDSWKTAFKSEGYEVECILKGLGEYKGIQDMFIAHAAEAMK